MPVLNHFYLVDNKISPALLKLSGPIIAVEISIPNVLKEYLEQKGLPIPNPVNGQALIDTGATNTCVDVDIIKQLKIPAINSIKVYTPSGEAEQTIHPVIIRLSIGTFNFNSAIGSILKKQNIIALLGRDILQNCVLNYNGLTGNISLSI